MRVANHEWIVAESRLMSSFLDPNFSGQLFKESHQMNKFQKKNVHSPFPPKKKQTSSFLTKKNLPSENTPPLPSFPTSNFPEAPRAQPPKIEAPRGQHMHVSTSRRRPSPVKCPWWPGCWACRNIAGTGTPEDPWDDCRFTYIYHTIHVGKIYHTSM